MNVHVKNFRELIQREWLSPDTGNGPNNTALELHGPEKTGDLYSSREKIRKCDIDRLADHPGLRSVKICDLSQDTFEYFVQTYGRQLKYIEFFNCKTVEDWSLLASLPELECLYFCWNQRISRMWDMSENHALKAVSLDNFTQLHDLSGVEKAPALEWFDIGDQMWPGTTITTLSVFKNTKVKRLSFSGKKIDDMDLSFIPHMPCLEIFDFPTNLFSTEQVAWLLANRPGLEGFAMKPFLEHMAYNSETNRTDIPAVIIVGKRKPSLHIEGNEAKIQKYVDAFEASVKKYRGLPYDSI